MPQGVYVRTKAYRAKMSAVKTGNPATRTNLRHGHTSSAGGKHWVSRTWKSWDSMKQRCLNPNAPNYHLYGGRGIAIDSSWGKFENFLSDMGERPDGTSLDRIDNNGSYTVSNCRWATPAVQGKNTRSGKRGRHPNSQANLTHFGTRESALKAWVTRRKKRHN